MENKTDYGAFKEILKKRLNEKRYYHSLCVADEAKRLAEKYGGGGHACASGATLKNRYGIRKVLADADGLIAEYKANNTDWM